MNFVRDRQRRAAIREYQEAVETGNEALAERIVQANPDIDFAKEEKI